MYGPEMDVWGAGCILFELTTLYPLFPGSDEVDQISKIHQILGTPNKNVIAKLKNHASNQANFHFPRVEGIGLKRLLPDAAPNCLDLLTRTLAYDKSNRITSKRCLKHSYFVGDVQSKISNKLSTNGSIGTRRKLHKHHEVHPTTTYPQPTKQQNHAPKVIETTEHGETDDVDENDEPTAAAAPKTRSMVSILLSRTQKKDFVQESKERNKTIYRKGKSNKKPAAAGATVRHEGKDTSNSTSTSFRKRQSKKFAHVASSGYAQYGKK